MYNVTESTENKDLLSGETLIQARKRYMDKVKGFNPHLPAPIIEPYEDKMVLRADLSPAGLKAWGAEQLVSQIKEDTLVYVAPRTGHAPHAIVKLAQMYGKKVVLFCPASKCVSNHQAAMLAYDNVELRFIRIAAMPVLNKYAREWAERNGGKFLPFGLTGTPLVTAGLVRAFVYTGKFPEATVCAVSTGTMIRALQIAWPDAVHYGVAVARNMHDGEIGAAKVWSSHQAFQQKAHVQPPFPSTATYDAKAWEFFQEHAPANSIFINVGSDAAITSNLTEIRVDSIDSARDWGDMRDLADV